MCSTLDKDKPASSQALETGEKLHALAVWTLVLFKLARASAVKKPFTLLSNLSFPPFSEPGVVPMQKTQLEGRSKSDFLALLSLVSAVQGYQPCWSAENNTCKCHVSLVSQFDAK